MIVDDYEAIPDRLTSQKIRCLDVYRLVTISHMNNYH